MVENEVSLGKLCQFISSGGKTYQSHLSPTARMLHKARRSISINSRTYSSVTLEAVLNDWTSRDRKFHASSFKSIPEKLRDMRLAFNAQRKMIEIKRRLFSSSSNDLEPSNGKDALTAAIELSALLSAHRIDYAIGGSLALGVWSTPRATSDADINIFGLDTDDVHLRVIDALCSKSNIFLVGEHAGNIAISRQEAVKIASRKRQIYAVVDGIHVNMFLPKTVLELYASKRKHAVKLDSQNVYFLDAETILTYKLLWKREKDLADAAGLFQVFSKSNRALDIEFVKEMLRIHKVEEAGNESFLVLQKMCARYLGISLRED